MALGAGKVDGEKVVDKVRSPRHQTSQETSGSPASSSGSPAFSSSSGTLTQEAMKPRVLVIVSLVVCTLH